MIRVPSHRPPTSPDEMLLAISKLPQLHYGSIQTPPLVPHGLSMRKYPKNILGDDYERAKKRSYQSLAARSEY